MSGEGAKVETPAGMVMFPATPEYGKLTKDSVVSSFAKLTKLTTSRAIPVSGDDMVGGYSWAALRPQKVDMEPILKKDPSDPDKTNILGYKCVVEGHHFTIVPVSAHKGRHPHNPLKLIYQPDPSKPLPFVPENRYFVHCESVVDTDSLMYLNPSVSNPSHPTYSILTDNVGNKIRIRQDKSTLYWPIVPEQQQLPDIIVDDIKSGYDGAAEAPVLERVNEHVATQDARVRELEAQVGECFEKSERYRKALHISVGITNPNGSPRAEAPAAATAAPALTVPGSATKRSQVTMLNELDRKRKRKSRRANRKRGTRRRRT